MYNEIIDWDNIPDIITKDQFYQICHISKTTALYLLRSGIVPCEYSGMKTRCYKIRKEDVKKYIEDKAIFPKNYSAPTGWYKGKYTSKLSAKLPPIILEDMHKYYEDLFKEYSDVLTTPYIVQLTGYSRSSVNRWCDKGHLKSFRKNNVYHIPKVFLIDFLCSVYFCSIVRKSSWHIKVLKAYPRWKNNKNVQTKESHINKPESTTKRQSAGGAK